MLTPWQAVGKQMSPNQTVEMDTGTRKGHYEEIEHPACHIIKTSKPGVSCDYDGTDILSVASLFIFLGSKMYLPKIKLLWFAYYWLIIDVI